jgi:hypothetical protein
LGLGDSSRKTRPLPSLTAPGRDRDVEKSRNIAAFLVSPHKQWFREKCVVADAVRCEPVSRANFLQTGNFTGKFAISSQKLEYGIAKTAVPQRYLTKLPTELN